jgi:hypothetical protein
VAGPCANKNVISIKRWVSWANVDLSRNVFCAVTLFVERIFRDAVIYSLVFYSVSLPPGNIILSQK